MINGHPQDWTEVFDHYGHFPVTCTNHDQPHAVNRDDATGEMRCTAGCRVEATPRVRDDEDRIGVALRRQLGEDLGEYLEAD